MASSCARIRSRWCRPRATRRGAARARRESFRRTPAPCRPAAPAGWRHSGDRNSRAGFAGHRRGRCAGRRADRLHPLDDAAVRRAEDGGILHAQRDELVDVEEAAVVDLVRGPSPEDERVDLRAEAGGDARVAALAGGEARAASFSARCTMGERSASDSRRRRSSGRPSAGARRALGAMRSAMAARRARRVCPRARRIRGVRFGRHRLEGEREHRWNRRRVERKAALAISNAKAPALERDVEFVRRYRLRELGAEYGDEHSTLETARGRVPVDVEPARVA